MFNTSRTATFDKNVYETTKATVGGIPYFSLLCLSHSNELLSTSLIKIL